MNPNDIDSKHLYDRSYKAGQLLSNAPPGENVVISGMAGKFPDSDDVYQFRDNLFNKVDLVTEDNRRWKFNNSEMPQRAGKLNGLSHFDAGFFGIPSRHANNMDVYIRMMLERSYEVIMDAGYEASELAGTKTGVFIGSNFSDCENYILYDKHDDMSNSLLGSNRSMIAQYISYYFNTLSPGPSYNLDSGCSSSMYALEHAYRSIRNGSCHMAIVGGVNLCLHPTITLHFARTGILSSEGRCKTFDNSADGYVRSEAILAVFLQKSKDARRIYAHILHSKLNADGYKQQGIGHPSSQMQAILMKQVYAESNVDLSDVSFVEAHGTGTKVGDLQELSALAEVFCSQTRSTLHIGAVKSNIGHTEPAGALSSIIKVLLGMEHGLIPPNINYSNPREEVDDLLQGRLKVITEKTPWPNSNGIVGVNSLGIGGANGHLVLRWNEKQKRNLDLPKDDIPRLVCASGRKKEALNAVWDDLSNRCSDTEFMNLLNTVFKKQISNHPFRGYQILSKVGELKRSVNEIAGDRNKLVWVFNNYDPKWPKVGKELMVFPVFAEAIATIRSVLTKNFDVDILGLLETFWQETRRNQILVSMTMQICLSLLLKNVGLTPDIFIGLGTGELIVAYLENYLTLDEVIYAHFCLGTAFNNNINKSLIGEQLLNNLKNSKLNRNARFQRWLSLYQRNRFHKQGLPEWFGRNLTKPFGLDEVQELLLRGCEVLVIGGEIKNFEHLSLIRENSQHYVTDFLTKLGGFYEKGHDLHLNSLYGKVTWPVNKGTPMISPLIKWDHTRNWRVAYLKNEEKIQSRQRTVYIDVKDKEWNFITGHVIDGRNLFPATGFLFLVWETLAEMNKKTIFEMKIIFEEIRFVQAVSLTNQDVDVKLTISILEGNKTFEISERDTLIMKGTVYEVLDERRERANLPKRFIKNTEDNISLKQTEIYRELQLKGYGYKGKFKGIECEIGKENGLIRWTGNWITFMDNMLQMLALYSENRNLHVPTSIKYLFIDPAAHFKVVEKAGDTDILVPVHTYCDLDIVRSGGIEFRGMKGTPITRRKDREPVLEVYKFIPNVIALSLDESVRVMVQIILENNRVTKFKSAEFAGDSKLISPLINNTLNDLLMIQAELVVLSKITLDIPGITFEDRSLSIDDNLLIVVLPRALEKNEVLYEAIKTVKGANGYVLTRENLNFDVSRVPDDLEVLCVHTTEIETLVLLRKLSVYEQPTAIDVSNDLNWLPPAQKAIKRNQPLIFYSQNRSTDGILGLVNCLRKEPDGGCLSCFFILDEAPEFDLNHQFYKDQIRKKMTMNVWKAGKWGTYRHLSLKESASIPCKFCYANTTVTGDLSSIKFIEGNPSENNELNPETQIFYIYWSALNFKDVLIATGRLSGNATTRNSPTERYMLGLEFSGRDISGNRVMGLATRNALATHIITDSSLVWKIPDDWSLEDAATVPTVYTTVIYAMLMRGNLKRRQSILIHLGTGGIGQASINIALHFDCTIFVTVGTQEKRDFLRKNYPQIKENHIGNSRDTSFEQMILLETNGHGVDVVLNSLSEDKLTASVRCLARNGTFLEIGKFDMEKDNELKLALFEKGVNFQSVMLDIILTNEGNSGTKRRLLRCFGDLLHQGVIKPLSRTVFKKEEVADAFKCMVAGKHIGKVLVNIREEEEELICLPKDEVFAGLPRYYCNPKCTYIIIGGLGGFGLELAGWLITRGAKKLILSSRTGLKTGYQAMMLRKWQSYDVEVFIRTDDVTTKEGCVNLVTYANSLGPVKAVFNLALVLKDDLFENQTIESFKFPFSPKVLGTQNLDTVTRAMCPQLSHFVVFSSTSCGRGNVEQSNYGMANSVMERICEKRKEEGFPALAIQWGAIGDVGVFAELQENVETEILLSGLAQQKISSCLQVLNDFLRQDEPVVSSMLVSHKAVFSCESVLDGILNILDVTSKEKDKHHLTFAELGMDSLMSAEIKQILERELEIFLSSEDIRSLTVNKLQDLVNKKVENKNNCESFEEYENFFQNLKSLLDAVDTEVSSKEPIVRMGDLTDNGIQIFILPGLEGTVNMMKPLIKKLNANVACVQYGFETNLETIEEWAEAILPYMDVKDNAFTLVAHSFGCVVATQLMFLLEKSGRRGKLVCIDGGPNVMTTIYKKMFGSEGAEFRETNIVCIYMMMYTRMLTVLKYKNEMLKCTSLEDRIRLVLNSIPKIDDHLDLFDISVQCCRKLKAMLYYSPKFSKLKSRVKLIKPKDTIIFDASKDYGLSSLFEKVENVEEFEGRHFSVVENPEVARAINKFIGDNN